MSIATLGQVDRTTRTRRPRAARKPATLVLTVDGVGYDLRPFDLGADGWGDGQSNNGMEHSLRAPDGPWFQVFGTTDPDGDDANYCERCTGFNCHHAAALAKFGLLHD